MSGGTSIRRILVALDASPASLEGLKAAADLAVRLDAELAGLFVEDANLLRAVESPFIREVCFFSPYARRLDRSQLERQLRVQAEGMRQALERIARQRGLAWDFRTRRGSVARELIAAAGDDDLIILGRVGRSLSGPRRAGATVRAVVSQRRGATLILRQTFCPDPAMVVYDGTASARKALDVAGHFAIDKEIPIRVFLLADSREAAEAYRADVENQLKAAGRAARFRPLISSAPAVVIYFVKMEETRGPLVLPGEKWQGREENLLDLVDEVPNPVLVVT
jgi:nucleotide-binding universal stress UspA family protein